MCVCVCVVASLHLQLSLSSALFILQLPSFPRSYANYLCKQLYAQQQQQQRGEKKTLLHTPAKPLTRGRGGRGKREVGGIT